MPKIPQYVASEGVPLTPGPEMRPDINAAPAEALASGAHRIEAQVHEGLRHVNAILGEKARLEQTSDAYNALLEGAKRRSQLEQDLKTGTIDEAGQPLEPAATSKDYAQRSNIGMEKIGRDIAAGIQDPNVRDIFVKNWRRESASAAIQAGRHQFELLQDEKTAEVTQNFHESLRSVAEADNPVDAKIRADLFKTYLTGMQNGIRGGAARAELIRQAFDKEVEAHNARVDIRSGISDEALEKKYEGKLDPGVLDQMIVRNASANAHAEIAKRQAMQVWAESVQRAGSKLVASGSLTQEFLDDFADAYTGEHLAAMNQVLRDQQLGRHTLTQNAEIGRAATSRVANRTSLAVNPEQELQWLAKQYNDRKIGTDLFIPYSNAWSSEIERRRNDSKASRSSEETEERRLAEHDYRAVINQVNQIFQPTDKYANFDAQLTIAKEMFIDQINKRSIWTGGPDQPRDVFNELLPKYLAPAQKRLENYIQQIQAQITYPDMQSLVKDKDRIGVTEFRRQAEMMKLLKDLRNANQIYLNNTVTGRGQGIVEPK